MTFFLGVIILSSLLAISSQSLVTKTHPDVGLNILELAEKHGYPIEIHEVETEDGYLLTVHRIPHGKTNAEDPSKPPIFLMHGLLSCSADWVNIGPGKSLAYQLADLGYDVWMGNARGNAESRKHKTLNPDTDKKAFWSFSWNEIGSLDLPAMIDYVLAETHQEQLQYVGFSQGTTSFFVMASTRPEYNAKLKLVTLLAPTAEVANIKNPIIKMIAPMEKIIYSITNILGIYEFLPRTESMTELGLALCDDGKPTQELCKVFLFAIAGYNRDQLDGSLLPVITSNTPAGANLKQLIHYFQLILSDFRKFDYHNETLNMEAYGSPVPPKYDLGLITAPVAMYYGVNDWLVSDVDTKSTASKLPNLVRLKEVDHPAFTHLDFVWAIDVVDLVFNDVIELIAVYAN